MDFATFLSIRIYIVEKQLQAFPLNKQNETNEMMFPGEFLPNI